MGQLTPLGNTPHWDTPYGTPKPGGGSKLGLVLIVLLVGGGLMCLGCMLMVMIAGEPTGLEGTGPQGSGTPVAASPKNVETEIKNAELAKLEETRKQIAGVVNRKLEPVIARFKKQLLENRDELVRLRDKPEHTNSDKFKMKKYLEERKEIKRYLKSLLVEREKYNTQLTELEFTVRRVKRNLEVSEFIDKKDRAEIEKLLARGSALMENADKGFEQGSLASEVEASSPSAGGGEPEVDLSELDAALSDE